MLLAVAAVVAGIVLLAWSADQFVLGAARVAIIRNVPSLVVGVVIIGFGTSAPELLVSVLAAAEGEPEVALGNVVGSNAANLLLMLGIAAAIIPVSVTRRAVRSEAPLAVAAVILFGVVVQGGGINRLEGVMLLVAMIAALWVVTRGSNAEPDADQLSESSEPSAHSLRIELARTILGLIGTTGAAQLLLFGALDIAHRANLSEAFVGLSMVAIGTSLPELVTVVQSARRKQTVLIVGNLLGSTLFNALLVGGAIGLTGPAAVDVPSLTILAPIAVIAAALLAFGAMWTAHTVTRWEGIGLIVAYFALFPFLT